MQASTAPDPQAFLSQTDRTVSASRASSWLAQHHDADLAQAWTGKTPSSPPDLSPCSPTTTRSLLGAPIASPPSAPFTPPPASNQPPRSPATASSTSAWLQSVTNNTETYVTSTISLSNSSQNTGRLVEHDTLSGVQVQSSGNNTGDGTFNGDASYTTSMQDLLYTLAVAVVIMTVLVVVHAGQCWAHGSSWVSPSVVQAVSQASPAFLVVPYFKSENHDRVQRGGKYVALWSNPCIRDTRLL